MKKLILIELTLLFLATTFQSDNPPGWYQQQLPVNNIINDMFFLDSLKGWIVTGRSGETAYVLHTTNGGNNWNIQFQQNLLLIALQFVDSNVGYIIGSQPPGIVLKTTNGGNNWFNVSTISAAPLLDLSFVNKDTGWICSDDLFDGGVFKTIDGGNNWIRLTGVGDFRKLFFLNKDTGWVYGHTTTQQRLYRTINGGNNWELQFVFPQQLNDIFFVNNMTGYVSLPGKIYKSTDCGVEWIQSQSEVGGIKLSFTSDLNGWAGYSLFNVSKTTSGGKTWYYQTTPTGNNYTVEGIDSLKAWAGGISLIHTTDGGGISGINNYMNIIADKFSLSQNYPNPFNPFTNIKYEINKRGFVLLKVFDISGKEIRVIVNQEQSEGKYSVEFNASTVAGGLPSGVYFYRLEVTYEINGRTYSDTKKMILIR